MNLNLTESTNLDFKVDIEGNVKKIESVSLCIENGNYTIKIPGSFNDNKVSCAVPVLEGIVEPGPRKVSLEFVIDGKVFSPFTDTIEFEKAVEVKSTLESIPESIAPVIKAKPILKEKAKPKHPGVLKLVSEAKTYIAKSDVQDSIKAIGAVLHKLKTMESGPEIAKSWLSLMESKGMSVTSIKHPKDAQSIIELLKAVL